MKRSYFFFLLVALFMFLYIGPVNFSPYPIPSVIPTEKNALSDEPMIGERILLERGSKTYLGSGQYSFSTSIGEYNTFNGSHYVPYLYDDLNHNATFAGHSIVLYDWYATFSNTDQILVDDMRWVVQYWREQGGGSWRELDLWDHSFLPVIQSTNKLSFGQMYTDGFSSLDVWYIVRDNDQMKVMLNFTTDTTGEYRFIWQFTGVDGDVVEGDKSIEFDDISIGWGDSELNATFDWVVANKKCDVIFDNVTVEAGSFYILDPSVHPVIGADSDDDWWSYDDGLDSWTHYIVSNLVYAREYVAGAWYTGGIRFSLTIPQGSTINSSNLTIWEFHDNGDQDVEVFRIDETNVGPLESDSVFPDIDYSEYDTWDTDGGGAEWATINVTKTTQSQINLGGWSSGYYIGFNFNQTGTGAGNQWTFHDYCFAGGNKAYMNVTYTEAPSNNDPVNDQVPTLDNADDSDNMYAQYREYKMTVYVSDADGYADIDYLEVGLWSNDQVTEYFRFRYDEDADTFSEEYDIGTVVSLNTGSSTATESGNDIDAQFWFTVDWDHADLTDVDTKCYVTDDEPASDTDWYEANFDVETRLNYTLEPFVFEDDFGTDDRGDFDEYFSIEGNVSYYGSSLNPSSDHIDMWVSASEYGTNVGPWFDLVFSAGYFYLPCYADDELGLDTYTIKPVEEGAGSGGSSLYYTTDLTTTYIADIAQVQSYTVSDSRVNINDNVNVDVTIYYDYDNTAITDGTVTINGESAAHQGSGVWRITVSESTVTSNTYDTVAVTGNTHGITTEDQNGQSTTVIWDRLVVTLSADGYSVVNGTQVNITISVVYDYDDASFTYYNLSMTRDAVFWYVFNHANSSLCNDTAADVEYTYTVNQLNNETTYGITAFISNSINIEWSAAPPITTTTTTTTITSGIFYQLFLSLNMWGYLGPALLSIGGYFVARKEKILGVFYFVVECLVAAHYFTLVDAIPQYWWHIIIILLGGMPVCIYSLWDK